MTKGFSELLDLTRKQNRVFMNVISIIQRDICFDDRVIALIRWVLNQGLLKFLMKKAKIKCFMLLQLLDSRPNFILCFKFDCL